MRARIAAHARWENTDPAQASKDARRRALDRYLKRVDPEGLLDPEERERRAEHARKADMMRLALASARARRLARELREAS
jgi:hypothetical protein